MGPITCACSSEGTCGIQLSRTMQLLVASCDTAELDGLERKLRAGGERGLCLLPHFLTSGIRCRDVVMCLLTSWTGVCR